MITLLTRALALVLLLTVASGTVRAGVPNLINYQGRVAVGAVNFDGAGQFKFALVNGAGTTGWSNDGTSVAGSEPAAAVTLTVTKGLYSVLLGDTALANMMAISPADFGEGYDRLRVWFNDGPHGFQLLAPDQRIAAVGYAMLAAGVKDGAITSDKIAAGAVGSAHLANNLQFSGGLTLTSGGIVLPATNGNHSITASTQGVTIDGITIGENTGITLPVTGGTKVIGADVLGISLDGIRFNAANGILLPNANRNVVLSASGTGALFDVSGGDFVVTAASGVRFETSGSGVKVDGKQATTAGEKLHIVRGSVNGDGTVSAGSGFTAALIPAGTGGTLTGVPLAMTQGSLAGIAIANYNVSSSFPKNVWLQIGNQFCMIIDITFVPDDPAVPDGTGITTVHLSRSFAGTNGVYSPKEGMTLFPSYIVTFAATTFLEVPVVTLGGGGGLPSQISHSEVYQDYSKPRTTGTFSVIRSPGINQDPDPSYRAPFEFTAVGPRQ